MKGTEPNQSPRALTTQEFALYSRLTQVLPLDEAAIAREQLRAAMILVLDDQNARFILDDPVRTLRFAESQTMTGRYADADGWPIDIIVHAVHGRLYSVERHRTDAGPIQNVETPPANAIRLELRPDRPGSPARATAFLREHPDWGDDPADFFPAIADDDEDVTDVLAAGKKVAERDAEALRLLTE